MVREVANQKRKRGLTADASRDDEGASQSQLKITKRGTIAQRDDADVDEEVRPRKRSRQAQQHGTSRSQAEASTRRKKAKEPRNGPADEGRRSQGERPEKKTSRVKPAQATKPNETSPREGDEDSEGDSSLLRRSGRARRAVGEWYKGTPQSDAQRSSSSADAREEKEEQEQSEEGDSSLLRRSGRERRSVGEWYKSTHDDDPKQHTEESELPIRQKKAGRMKQASVEDRAPAATGVSRRGPKQRNLPSQGETTVQGASEGSGPKRKSRNRLPPQQETSEGPSKQKRRNPREQEAEPDSPAEEAHPRRPKPRSSDASSPSRRRPRSASQEEARSRSRSSSPEPEDSPAPYRRLRTETRRIARATIEEKWSPLDPISVSNVTSVLQSTCRPVLLRLPNQKKHQIAQAALNAVSNRLRNKLARGLPFPPVTSAVRREDELDYERTVAAIQTLEAQLDPLLHGVALLKREKERMQHELERDYKVLNSLSINARSEGRQRREQLRKMHELVPPLTPESEQDYARDDETGELTPAEKGAGKTFIGLESDEMKGLAEQIASHMESMRGNLGQIEGVQTAVMESRVALNMALLENLDTGSYQRVSLG